MLHQYSTGMKCLSDIANKMSTKVFIIYYFALCIRHIGGFIYAPWLTVNGLILTTMCTQWQPCVLIGTRAHPMPSESDESDDLEHLQSEISNHLEVLGSDASCYWLPHHATVLGDIPNLMASWNLSSKMNMQYTDCRCCGVLVCCPGDR